MSTEPERPIEKQLRAYASKRRTEAGAPFELHPATRRLLQGEIARKSARAPSRLFSLTRVLFQLWPRFAFIIPLIMVSGLFLLYKVFDKKQPLEIARNIPASTVLSEDEIASKDMASRSVAEGVRTEGQIGGPALIPSKLPEINPALRNNRLAVAPQTAEAEKAVSLKGAETLSLSPAGGLAQQEAASRPDEATIVRTPAAVPSVQGDFLSYDGSGLESATQRFAQVLPARNSPTSSAVGAKGVLTSFQMERVGDQIRVIDKDGSTYVGHLQKVNAPVKQQIDDGRALINEARKAKTLASAPADRKDSKSEVPAPPDYFFRVVGTNRNLKQQVIFSGHLLTNSSSADIANAKSTAGAEPIQASVPGQGIPQLFNSRIDGTALVGGSNILQIQAVPVAPR